MAFEYIQQFKKFGFGMFVHFGLYSIVGKGEWYLSMSSVSATAYQKLPEKFRVDKNWAKRLVSTAKAAGCKYITLTTRHHEGFSLYNTQGLNTYDAPHSAAGRDLISEFVSACRKENIVPFFYHTLLDWHNEDYKANFPRYIDYLIKSVEILCRNYGKIGGFWFDGKWDKPNEDWQEDRMYAIIRKYQPEAMIINNTGLNALGQVGHKEIDSVTFERGKPCFVDVSDKPRAGEMCEGITDHWGYTKDDICVKTAPELIETLVNCRKYSCNLLLNTGLKGNGEITEGEKAAFLNIGKWIKANGEFIYNAVPAEIQAENATLFKDGKDYYAVLERIPMCANSNVARAEDFKHVRLDTKQKIIDAQWLDNAAPIKINEDNSFDSVPFDYGTSLSARVAKFRLK